METHYKNVFNQIRRVLTRPICWEAVMRTRFSKNYKVSSFTTPILISNGDLLVMPAVDADQTYTMTLEIQEGESNSLSQGFNENILYLQVKVLFKSSVLCYILIVMEQEGLKFITYVFP
jgi:hypothetical protein